MSVDYNRMCGLWNRNDMEDIYHFILYYPNINLGNRRKGKQFYFNRL